jgi:hypothetical protein
MGVATARGIGEQLVQTVGGCPSAAGSERETCPRVAFDERVSFGSTSWADAGRASEVQDAATGNLHSTDTSLTDTFGDGC